MFKHREKPIFSYVLVITEDLLADQQGRSRSSVAVFPFKCRCGKITREGPKVASGEIDAICPRNGKSYP
ncbi:hypothetical protein SAMN05421852_1407 [Thermoflavimicrobium dichotomicum]|uniref:Uncharacterized protein n=1 Tax=Thermoflavimicrobium dichotomicum TaxID=46223 RepID=A0A1I3VDV4_9BACL|nr:hypothetical protein SAMN05421852_1407 [Thermoflavimicrobium dichotomicum]